MLKTRYLFPLFLMTGALILSACQLGASTSTATPTAFIAPDPLAEDWLGDWNVWVQETWLETPEILKMNASASTLNGEVFLNDGDRAVFSADLNSDGRAAVGDWLSDQGKSGRISLVISEDGSQFVGSLQGVGPMCAVRDGNEIPDLCESEFDLNWDGGWFVWVGSEEIESTFFYNPNGNSIGPLAFKINADVSGENSQKLLGSWEAMGSKGTVELILDENGIQFTGNMNEWFPFCGVRPGGEKPDPCYGP